MIERIEVELFDDSQFGTDTFDPDCPSPVVNCVCGYISQARRSFDMMRLDLIDCRCGRMYRIKWTKWIPKPKVRLKQVQPFRVINAELEAAKSPIEKPRAISNAELAAMIAKRIPEFARDSLTNNCISLEGLLDAASRDWRAPVEMLSGSFPAVLYFPDEASRQEFWRIIRLAAPHLKGADL